MVNKDVYITQTCSRWTIMHEAVYELPCSSELSILQVHIVQVHISINRQFKAIDI